MDGRTDVVNESRERQVRRVRTAADGIASFKHTDGTTGACQFDRGRQSIGSGADDDRVIFHEFILSSEDCDNSGRSRIELYWLQLAGGDIK